MIYINKKTWLKALGNTGRFFVGISALAVRKE